MQKNNLDYLKIIEKINIIQNLVIKKGQNISTDISELKFLLASRNNDKIFLNLFIYNFRIKKKK